MLSDYDRHVMKTLMPGVVILSPAAEPLATPLFYLLRAKRPFLFGKVEAPQPPAEGSPEHMSTEASKQLLEEIQEAEKAFKERPIVHERTGEVLS
ncbi:uncharacterized protein EMH_0081050 [Eimeria mitis]|uniref:Uncharacterized protein n=1 Tax=Eimeria mitis TaxID=44415 RepID=U6KEE0_9EIME|nr:uncharacterized protein EMH_0081050 [Eimeria mitis]CDJ36365.1 hypothetical protein, conserved [Eimeria mitis]